VTIPSSIESVSAITNNPAPPSHPQADTAPAKIDKSQLTFGNPAGFAIKRISNSSHLSRA
jgi:hypothetical protein